MKTMKDLEGKISADDKTRLETEIANVRSALNGTDSAAISSATERLTQTAQEVFGKIYQQDGAAGAAQGGVNYDANAGAQQGGQGPVDAEYEVVDDNNNVN